MARWYMVLYELKVNPSVTEIGRFPVLSPSAHKAIEAAQIAFKGIAKVSVKGIPNQSIQLFPIYYS